MKKALAIGGLLGLAALVSGCNGIAAEIQGTGGDKVQAAFAQEFPGYNVFVGSSKDGLTQYTSVNLKLTESQLENFDENDFRRGALVACNSVSNSDYIRYSVYDEDYNGTEFPAKWVADGNAGMAMGADKEDLRLSLPEDCAPLLATLED